MASVRSGPRPGSRSLRPISPASGRRRGGDDGLTETEDRVARLAAAGMTNREVGEAAFLTAKSVEGVLARVYGKLGIRSRAELGAWLAGQDADVGAARVTGRED